MNATVNATSEGLSVRRPNAYQIILLGGLIAGTLDLTAACVTAWLRASVSPVRVMQSIAAGLLGAASYTGGTKIMFCVGLPIAAIVRRFSK